MNTQQRLELKKKQYELSDRCVQVNRTAEVHHEVLRVNITFHCNRNCSFCYSQGLQKKFRRHMSSADFRFLAGWAKEQGWKSLRFLGGEPTVHPAFEEFLRVAGEHGFTVSFSTNGMYGPGTAAGLKRSAVESVNFSYPQDGATPGEMARFRANIDAAVKKRLPVVLSWVLQPDGGSWKKIIALAGEYGGRVVVRFSMVLPGHAKNFTVAEFRDYIRRLGRQILSVARYAYSRRVVFYFYRPLLLCMFTKKESAFLRSISPSLFDSICSCSCVEGTLITVNPDLSCAPCPSLSSKGLTIVPGTKRADITADFKSRLKRLSTRPLLPACRTCRFFRNYKRLLADRSLVFQDGELCSAGCYQYRV